MVASLDLYEFNQVNNNEMGILISRDGRRRTFPTCSRRSPAHHPD